MTRPRRPWTPAKVIPSSAVMPPIKEHRDHQPHRRPAEDAQEAPQPVDPDVGGDAGHGGPGRPGRSRVADRDPHLEGHEADLGPEPDHDQHPGHVVDGAGPDGVPAGDAEAAGAPGQQQEGEQQRGAAHLADADGRPRGAGLSALRRG